MRHLLIFATAFLVATPALAEVHTWNCDFTYRIDENGKANEKMLLVFKIDTVSRRGFMEGNLGIVDVNFHIGNDAFSFMDLVASGVVQTTTITRDGLAVHSRNTVMFGEIVAAQHFGRCTPE